MDDSSSSRSAMKRAVASCCMIMAIMAIMAASSSAAASYTPTKDPAAVQLSASVLVMGEYDWALYTGSDGKPWSRCLDSVWRARKYSSGNRLNFVPTHHWLCGSDGWGVSSFCYMHSSGAGDKGSCMPWTPSKLAEFTKSMTLCFTEAFVQGFTPYVRPHLDDGLNRGVWRNSLSFSPTVKYGDYSYQDVMTNPLSEAMRDALAAAAKLGKLATPPDRSRPVVYMALQGEMSATIMRYTSAWASLIPAVKAAIGSDLADVKVGIGLNFNALDAVDALQTNTQTGTSVLSLFMGTTGASSAAAASSVPAIDGGAVNDLLSNKIDFVGISAYAPYSGAGFGTSEFQNAAFNVGDSLAKLANGLKLYSLANSGRLELHYSEFGIGGGVDGKAVIAASADACAKQPWAGITGSYSTSMDPWQRSDLSSFRSSFYDKALDWLSQPPGSGTYAIKEVFVWGMASWDAFGIYPDSNSASGSYRDISICRKVARHDAAIIASQVCAYNDAEACGAFVKANAACLNDQSGTACLDRSSPTKPDVVTEAGPKPSTGGGGGSTTPADTTSTANSSSSGDALEMSPSTASAASPAPGASLPVSSIVGPPSGMGSSSSGGPPSVSQTKNAAGSKSVWLTAAFMCPMLLSVLFLA